MKRFIPLGIFFVVVLLLAVGLTRDPGKLPSALIDKPLPQFVLPELYLPEQMVHSDELAGEPWVLNIWASWCVACVAEHQVFLDWKQQDPNLRLVGLNYKDDSTQAKQWLQRLGGSPYHRIAVDQKGSLGIDLGIYGVPETFIVSADNFILHRFAGSVTAADVQELLAPLLEQERAR